MVPRWPSAFTSVATASWSSSPTTVEALGAVTPQPVSTRGDGGAGSFGIDAEPHERDPHQADHLHLSVVEPQLLGPRALALFDEEGVPEDGDDERDGREQHP